MKWDVHLSFFALGITVYIAMLIGRISWPDYMDIMALHLETIGKRLVMEKMDLIRLKIISKLINLACKITNLKYFSRLFLSLDWDDVEKKKLTPPIIPTLTHPGDTRNLEEYSDTKWRTETLSIEELNLFKNF